MAKKRTFGGFAAQASDHGFVVHIIDDEGEVFEIDVSRENLGQLVRDMQALLASTEAPAKDATKNAAKDAGD